MDAIINKDGFIQITMIVKDIEKPVSLYKKSPKRTKMACNVTQMSTF